MTMMILDVCFYVQAIDFVALTWDQLTDPYDLAVVTYVLHKALHPAKDQVGELL